MATVVFSNELQPFTGESRTTVAAIDYRSMVDELCNRYPRIDRAKLLDMAVAIDGVIIVDPLLEPLSEASEVHFLHFIAGG